MYSPDTTSWEFNSV